MKAVNLGQVEYGENLKHYLMVTTSEVRKAKNDSLFLDIVLKDSFGNEINGKLWNALPEMEIYQRGMVVAVDGLIQKFNGRPQLKINKIRPTNEGDDVNPEDFIESAPETAEEMLGLLYATIEQFENEELKKVTRFLLKKKEERLAYYPAAKTHHHAIKAGLLFHIVTMLRLAKSISGEYSFINKDLLYAGVMLHDLSKVDEMSSDELGIVDDYTKEGKLLGHIIQGIKELELACVELEIDEEVKLALEHLLLSHHYHAEYGSPKKPLLPEGELLHYIDLIDARMYAMDKVLQNTEKGTFAQKSMTLDGRSMYKADL
ncbi:MAG TPA: CMP-binding protein [Eubacteriaceae bacterium]|nr:CMP-binding protein [Eubacteriaceae bacterium]